MINMNELRFICSCDLVCYDDLSFFKRIRFRIALKKQLKKAFKNQLNLENIKLSDVSYNEKIQEYFK